MWIYFALYQLFLLSFSTATLFERFQTWITAHNIRVHNNTHLAHLFTNWVDNDNYITEINSRNLSYRLAHNAYSGYNIDEFTEFMTVSKYDSSLRGFPAFTSNLLTTTIPTITNKTFESVDWREKNVVALVQDQGQCGSCYAFSATSVLESVVAIQTGILTKLSEQQPVSCSIKYGNLKCNGGYYNNVWDYVKDNGGQCSLQSYPYTSGDGSGGGDCIKTCQPVANTKVTSYVKVQPNSDDALLSALLKNPVSIAIEADTRSFQLYSSGVYDDFLGCNKNSAKNANSEPNIDHAVVLVGFGTTSDGIDYYILRNSWGTSWGENGYQRIARGSTYGKYGMCGVLYDPMYPVIS